jgi:hypothetical protein
MSERGTDPTTERRKAGPRAVRKVGVERWVENVFFGLAEVAVLGIPGLLALMAAPQNAAVKFAALVGVTTLTLAIGTVRTGLTSFDWPAATPVLFLVRPVYHSVTVVAVAAGGAAVDVATGSTVGSLVVAVGLALGAVRLFPRIVAGLERLLPQWNWGLTRR